MNKERLLTLANFLDSVPKSKFNLETWRDADEEEDYPYLFEYITDDKLADFSCGTTGCAIGWACVIPEFIEQGLQWNTKEPQYMHDDTMFYSWSAVEEFFGLSESEADYLFYDTSYIITPRGPKYVAERIRSFIT